MKKRLEYMDMVKGIGILSIVAAHSKAVPEQVATWIASFAPPLFFMVSGMLIGCTGEPERAGRDVLRRKARSLLLPFLYFSVLYILRDIPIVMAGILNEEDLYLEGIYLVSLWGSSVLWFLPALFLTEILFLALRRKLNTIWTCVFVALLTIVSYFANGALQAQEAFFLSGVLLEVLYCLMRTVLRALYALPYLCMGYVLFREGKTFRETETGRSPKQFMAGAALFLAGIPISVINGYFDLRLLDIGGVPVLAYLSAPLSIVGVVFLCKNSRPIKPLAYFGKNSLIVMVTHIDFYFLFLALNLAYRVNEFIPRFNRVFFFINVVGTILILEVVCITLINRFFPFLIGKRKYSHSGESLV